MPTPLVLNDILEVKFYNADGKQQAINTLHWLVTALAGTSRTDEQVATALGTVAAPLYKAYMPATAEYLGVRVQVIGRSPKPIAQISLAGAGQGTDATDPMPSFVSGLITKRTDFAGPSGRGRVFLPFWPEDLNNADGEPSAAAVVLMDNWGGALLGQQVVAGGGNSVTLSPVLHNRTTLSNTVITDYLIREEWYYQVRRSNAKRPDVFGPTL